MNLLIKIYSFIYKLYFRLRYGNKLSGIVYRCSFKGVQSNTIETHGYIAKTNVIFEGQDNSISTDGRVENSFIRIIGNNNRLVVESACIIPNITILFRGNNQLISIGKNTYMRKDCKIVSHGDSNYITIGKNCVFSNEVNIWNSDTHQILDNTGKVINPSKPVIIDDHVWIGHGTSIIKGVRIGKDSVIGMASVVSKDIQNNSIAAGVPAKIIKENINWSSDFVQDVNIPHSL